MTWNQARRPCLARAVLLGGGVRATDRLGASAGAVRAGYNAAAVCSCAGGHRALAARSTGRGESDGLPPRTCAAA